MSSLSIRFLDGARGSVISGMVRGPRERREVFYFRGALDGGLPLTAPIGGHTLAVRCAAAGCRDFRFTPRWSDWVFPEAVTARVYFPRSSALQPDTVTCVPDSLCSRWREMLSGINEERSNVVEARYRGKRYLSVTLVGTGGRGAIFHAHDPSEGGNGVIGYDHESADGNLSTSGHGAGVMTLTSAGVFQLALPGGNLRMEVR